MKDIASNVKWISPALRSNKLVLLLEVGNSLEFQTLDLKSLLFSHGLKLDFIPSESSFHLLEGSLLVNSVKSGKIQVIDLENLEVTSISQQFLFEKFYSSSFIVGIDKRSDDWIYQRYNLETNKVELFSLASEWYPVHSNGRQLLLLHRSPEKKQVMACYDIDLELLTWEISLPDSSVSRNPRLDFKLIRHLYHDDLFFGTAQEGGVIAISWKDGSIAWKNSTKVRNLHLWKETLFSIDHFGLREYAIHSGHILREHSLSGAFFNVGLQRISSKEIYMNEKQAIAVDTNSCVIGAINRTSGTIDHIHKLASLPNRYIKSVRECDNRIFVLDSLGNLFTANQN